MARRKWAMSSARFFSSIGRELGSTTLALSGRYLRAVGALLKALSERCKPDSPSHVSWATIAGPGDRIAEPSDLRRSSSLFPRQYLPRSKNLDMRTFVKPALDVAATRAS
jgi:hypothetical protein